MVQNVISGVVATLISAIIISLAKRAYAEIEKADTSALPEKKIPKKRLYRKFLCYLFSFAVFFALAISIPRDSSFGFVCLKSISALISGFAFLFAWGVFDTAFAYYPPDDAIDIPSDDSANDCSGNDK